MRRLIVVICAVALLAVACGEQQLGRRIVECEGPSQSIGTTIIITAQAVPGADFIPCVEALRPGWTFEHVQARSGQAFFTLNSDRMGDDFLRVTLLPSCDVGTAREVDSDEQDTTLSIEVLENKSEFVVVVVPVAERHAADADWVAAYFASTTINVRRLVTEVDDSIRPISEKVATAHAAGHPVVIIDDIDIDGDAETVSLRRVGGEEEPGLLYQETLAQLEDDVDDPAYRARWFYTFTGGCIRYDIDAEGEGAQFVERDVADAIGMYPMEEMRKLARDAGYRGFE
jgi:hypothetical protein